MSYTNKIKTATKSTLNQKIGQVSITLRTKLLFLCEAIQISSSHPLALALEQNPSLNADGVSAPHHIRITGLKIIHNAL